MKIRTGCAHLEILVLISLWSCSSTEAVSERCQSAACETEDNGEVMPPDDEAPDSIATQCDSGLSPSSDVGWDYAKALGLCRSVSVDGDDPGVLSAVLSLVDGSASPMREAHAIRTAFGDAIRPQAGESMVVLSTGRAAAPGDANPSYAPWQPGTDNELASGFPADWIASHGGILPNAPGCPALEDSGANDGVMLTLNLRVPQDANAFSLQANFLSSEYPEWVCSPYNDFMVVLLDSQHSGSPANPVDKNLAVYTAADGAQYPLGVNLAALDTGLFRQCENGATGCGVEPAVGSTTTTCTGIEELAGTGMELPALAANEDDGTATCSDRDLVGGGTGWLDIRGNVVPGEIITLRMAIWDTGDGMYDSVVALDGFQWLSDSTAPGTHIVQ